MPGLVLSGDNLSPPEPIHSLPSAIPAAIRPVDDIAVDKTKGGDNDTPLSGAVAATVWFREKHTDDQGSVRTNINL